MVLVVKDRIKDTSSTSGSGTISLDNSPPAGYQAFSTLGNGSTTYYAIQGSDDSFEIGLGTYNANTLTRTTILSSSNNGVIINLPSGSHTVWVDYPAAKAYLSEEGIDKSFTSTAGIAAGKPVILNSAGTVTQVAESTIIDASPTTKFSTMDGSDYSTVTASSIYEPNSSTFSIVYKDDSNGAYGTCVCGTWSNGTVTWGTPVVFNSSAIDDSPHIASGSNRIHVTYRRSTSGCIRSASISGTTPTFAAETVWETNASLGYHLDYDTSNDYVVILYYISGSARVIAVSYNTANGTYTAVSSHAQLNTTNIFSTKSDIVFDPDTNRSIVAYLNNSTNNITANVIQTGGTTASPTITAGSDVVVDSGDQGGAVGLTYDTTNNKVFLGYQNSTDNEWKGLIGTVNSGTNAITFAGEGIIWNPSSGNTANASIIFDDDSNKIIFFYRDSENGNDLTYKIITSGASSFTVASGSVLSANDNRLNSNSASFGAGKGVLLATVDSTLTYKVSYASLYYGSTTTSNLTASNYLGVASTSAGANASVNINIPGSINNDQTGLTIGRNYYTSGNGVISTTLSSNFVGRAISSTQLLLEEKKGNSMDGLSNGAITKGKPVVMQADGDVAQAKETSSSITFAQGNATELEEGWIDQRLISYDVNENKFLVTYRDQDNSSHGYCKVLSVSGTTVSYGSQSSAFNSSSTNIIDSVYDPESGNHVIFYQNGSSQYGYGVVASISGTSVTFGTPVAFNSANTHYRGTCYYDSTNKKVVWVGGAFESGAYALKSIVATVSGTSITFGTISDSGVSSSDYYSSAYDTNSSIGVYAYSNSSSDGYIGTLSISGTSITWNTPVNFNGSDNVQQKFDSMGYDSVNKKIVHFFKDAGTSSLQAIVGTVSGTSISFGTKVQAVSTADGGNTDNMATIGTLQGVMALVYRDARSGSGNGYLRYLQGTVSGTSISFAGGVLLDGTNTEESPAIAYDSNNYGIVTSYSDISTHDLWAVAVTPSGTVVSGNLTATNYLGMASDTVANNENATIQTQGAVNSDQSSLTAGQLYYVQTDGTLSTTAGSPSVIAGIATSATTLLVTKS